MKRLTVLLVLLAAACGGSSKAPPQAQPKASPKALTCAALFTAGAVIPASVVTSGCTDTDGNVDIPGTFLCRDGRHLLGDDRGWGFVGTPMTLGNSSTAAGYKAAYHACFP